VRVETVTPTQLAERICGQSENYSRSRGASRIRRIARDLFGVQHRPWHFTPDQVAQIRRKL
jgi:hypothetical protein